MYEPSRDALSLAPHRDAVAPVADRDGGVGNAHPFGERAGETREFLDETHAGARERSADAPQLGRGPIRDPTRGVEGGRDPLLERPVTPQPADQEHREAIGIESFREPPGDPPRRHDLRAGEQVAGVQPRIVDRQAAQRRSQLRERIQVPPLAARQERLQLAHGREGAAGGGRIGERTEGADLRLPRLGCGVP